MIPFAFSISIVEHSVFHLKRYNFLFLLVDWVEIRCRAKKNNVMSSHLVS